MVRKVVAVLLAFVVVIMTSGFTLSTHFCGGKKVKTVFNITNSDVSCGMEKNTNNCASKKQMKSNCCQNEIQLIQLDEDYTQQITDFDFSPDFLIAFITSYVELFENETTEVDFFSDHSPPPLIKDIHVLIQSFLI